MNVTIQDTELLARIRAAQTDVSALQEIAEFRTNCTLNICDLYFKTKEQLLQCSEEKSKFRVEITKIQDQIKQLLSKI